MRTNTLQSSGECQPNEHDIADKGVAMQVKVAFLCAFAASLLLAA